MSCTFKACRICLATGTKLYNFNHYELKHYYEQIMTSNVMENDGLPCYFCYECAAMLHKFHKFKDKCYLGQRLLKQVILKQPTTLKSVCDIRKQTKSLQTSLNVVTINNKVKTFIIRQRGFAKDNRIKEPLEIHVEAGPVSDDDDDKRELPPLLELINVDKKVNKNEAKININKEKTNEDKKIVLSKNFLEDCNKGFSDDDNDVKEPVDNEEYTSNKRKKRNTRASNKKKTTSKDTEEQNRFKQNNAVIPDKKYDLNLNNWLKINLTEEQAVEEFKSRALEKRYISAKFRCDLCLKSFSKEDMLHRHNKLRHAESIGPIECRFCRMRFRYKSLLSRHIRQHFSKYKCLRCDLVCPFESTAQLHEQYHNGVTRKCAHCGEEFKHLTTYYTHLRKHRSEHVCTLCGEAFISQLGLKMHQKKKHVKADTVNSQGAKEEQEFCKRCNIKFETKKAYEEHLIHSAMHVDGIEDLEVDTPVISNPIKKRPNVKKHQRIPTDCHICGAHFSTQAACMKHHSQAHPRTSFHSPNERYICEICGASLAPGSIATHLNLHTREKLHTCDTCGRQFPAIIGLRRHMVTHTGEKPYACPLCDKRFTQSNSMKLHYKTFHLKLPYPKRNKKE